MAARPRDEIGFEHKGIGDVLAQNRLTVPPNQREYSWEDEHVQELLADFTNAIQADPATYFLGTIVLTRGTGDLEEVSDGQQRLATTTILLASIRDYFFRNGDETRARTLDKFLYERDRKTTDLVPKLVLNVDDRDYFTKAVLAEPDDPDRATQPTKESHKRIERAAGIAKQHIADILKPHPDSAKTDRLLEWVDFIEKDAQVILLRVPDHLNAFVMFETLNDRGLKASQADLIKNHLLSLAGNRIDEAQSKWAAMVGVLESLGQEDITVTYLQHMLITKYGPTKAREVWARVRSHANSKSRALTFMGELADGAGDYAALFNPDHSKWNDYGTATREHLTTINRDLHVEQIRPLMFAVARHFSVPEAQKAFRMFVFWSVRFLIVGGRGGLLESNYGQAALDVGSSNVTTASALFSSLSRIIPNDAAFEAAFAEARVSQVFLARYYLRALERANGGEAEPEWIPNVDARAVNLEHVLPQNPESNWPGVDSDAAAANWRRIGNLVILRAKKNSTIGNQPFTDKRPVLQDSGFALTAEVGAQTTWGVAEIADRQKRLAKLAVKTWPLKA